MCVCVRFELTGNRYANHLDIVKLEDNCVASLSHLSRSFDQASELYLAGNRLADLAGLENFPEVEILDVSKNRLGDVDSLRGLGAMEELRDLRAEGNPFALGETDEAYREKVAALLPNIDCLDDRDVASRRRPGCGNPAAPSASSSREGEGEGEGEGEPAKRLVPMKPRAPAGARPPSSGRRGSRPLSASRPGAGPSKGNGDAAAAPMMHQRPMSARSGAGSRLLTASQYEDESKAFEEQVFGYQQAMGKLLTEMKRNLELPMEEVASMMKASGEDAWTASLPEPPVIATIKQHKESHIVSQASAEVQEHLAASAKAQAKAREGAQAQAKAMAMAGGMGMGAAIPEVGEEFGMANENDAAGAARLAYARFPSGEGIYDDDDDDDEGAPSLRIPEVEQYEYLKEDDGGSAAPGGRFSRGGGRDTERSPDSKSPKQLYTTFRVPARPLSARKSASLNKDAKPTAAAATKVNSKSGTLKGTEKASAVSVSVAGGGKARLSCTAPSGKTKLAASKKVTVPKVSRLKGNTFKLKS